MVWEFLIHALLSTDAQGKSKGLEAHQTRTTCIIFCNLCARYVKHLPPNIEDWTRQQT